MLSLVYIGAKHAERYIYSDKTRKIDAKITQQKWQLFLWLMFFMLLKFCIVSCWCYVIADAAAKKKSAVEFVYSYRLVLFNRESFEDKH